MSLFPPDLVGRLRSQRYEGTHLSHPDFVRGAVQPRHCPDVHQPSCRGAIPTGDRMSAPGIFGPDRCAKLIRTGAYVGIRPLRLVAGPGHWAARADTAARADADRAPKPINYEGRL